MVRGRRVRWRASLWFCGLGFGARYASPLLARPRAWQVLDVLIGVVMLLIALQLAPG